MPCALSAVGKKKIWNRRYWGERGKAREWVGSRGVGRVAGDLVRDIQGELRAVPVTEVTFTTCKLRNAVLPTENVVRRRVELWRIIFLALRFSWILTE